MECWKRQYRDDEFMVTIYNVDFSPLGKSDNSRNYTQMWCKRSKVTEWSEGSIVQALFMNCYPALAVMIEYCKRYNHNQWCCSSTPELLAPEKNISLVPLLLIPHPSTLTRETYLLVRGRLGLDFWAREAFLILPNCVSILYIPRGWLLMLPRGKCLQRNNFLPLFPYEEVFSKTHEYFHLASAYLTFDLLLCVNTYPQNFVEFFKPGV